MKEDLINKLVDTFKKETEKYSNVFEGVVNYKYEEFFKKNNPEKGYHSVDASIMFKHFTLKLEYKINISMLIPKSILEMRFVFEEGKLPVEYSIYDVLSVIDKDNFKCYTFPYITSESKVQEILKYLVYTFSEYKDRIEELSVNREQIDTLEEAINNNINLILNEKIFESRDAFYLMHMLELYYVLDISRYTTDGYADYVEGKYKQAIKKYEKLGDKLTCYEQRLLEYMKKGDVQQPIATTYNTLAEAKKFKSARMEFVPMFLSWIIITPIWCVIYDIIFYIALYIFSKDALYVGGAQSLMLFLPAFVTAIINSFFARKIVYKIFFRKHYDKILALDNIENSGKAIGIMTKLFQFVIAIGIVISILVANTNIAFYEDDFRDNLDLLRIKGEVIQYEDVHCVYRANGIKNDFGQIVNNPTYVIVLDGGRLIELYYYMDFEDIKENIIPIFEKHNIEIRQIDLVNNIKYSLQK